MSRVFAFAALAALSAVLGSAQASEASDALADCLYKNTTQADRNAFVQWAFVTIGKAEAAKSVATISQAKTREVEKNAQTVLTRIVMKSCPKPAMDVLLSDPKKGLENTLTSLAYKLAADEMAKRASPLLNLTITDLMNSSLTNLLKR